MMRSPLDIPRRSFLSRLALGSGAALLTPFVQTLAAEAQGVTRKRFLLVLQGNGFAWRQFTPLELREPTSTADHIQLASQTFVNTPNSRRCRRRCSRSRPSTATRF